MNKEQIRELAAKAGCEVKEYGVSTPLAPASVASAPAKKNRTDVLIYPLKVLAMRRENENIDKAAPII